MSRRVWFLLLLSMSLGLGCPTADDDDSAGDDDDSVADDDDSAGDDDDSGGDACAWALAAACADEVVEAPGEDAEAPFGDASLATNGVRGAGATAGGADVYSLDWGARSSLTLRWSGRRVRNGPGVDLVVFENAFETGADSAFMDLIVVEVSIDGAQWVAFPHDYVAADEEAYSPDPADWVGFAGRSGVLLHEEDNRVDPVDPSVAGGDGFDLDALPDDGGLASQIKADGFVYLRLVAAATRVNPDTGAEFVADAISNGPDIDGVYAAVLEDASR